MVYRHSLLARITHLLFAVCFAVLAVTGAQIAMHRHWLKGAPHIHQYAGVVMIVTGAVFFANGLLTGEIGKLLFRPKDTENLWPMLAYYLRLRRGAPVYADYNPLQKLAYTFVLMLIAPLIAATGVAMWTKLGGRVMEFWHLGFAAELLLFTFGHVVMVATTGVRNNIRSMVTGWYQPPAGRSAAVPERAPTKGRSRPASQCPPEQLRPARL
ncbi:MAG TPA: cytochrome b/b6 domain-containing protein [Candidatus Baltobacteraceae bacterium]|jgi:thiosulfate reductase cytochrome b subunit|nr:cytochrome b/b6 domain-containing protein [Candidatus Baltobacteraceae bacterium]